MALYGKVEYWDQRYQETYRTAPSCDWFRSYGHLRHLLNPLHFATANGTTASLKGRGGPLLPKASSSFPSREHSRVLILGCGNSSFGADMLRDGWNGHIVCVDFSQIVIDQMKNKYSKHFYDHLPKPHGYMEFICADVTQKMDFAADGSFDLVICKATLDVVLCSAGSKNAALAMVRETARVLSPDHGIFFLVTDGNSDNRLEYLERQNDLTYYWHGVSIHRVEPKHHKPIYCYICRRHARTLPITTTTTTPPSSSSSDQDVSAETCSQDDENQDVVVVVVVAAAAEQAPPPPGFAQPPPL